MGERRALATPAEVAEYLNVPPRLLSQWRYLGSGPRYSKPGGRHVRYRWADVEAWLSCQQGGGESVAS